MTRNETIYLTRHEDGTFLAASIDLPRFCVGGGTKSDARAKALRAVDYFNEAKYHLIDLVPRSTRVISPHFEPEKICA